MYIYYIANIYLQTLYYILFKNLLYIYSLDNKYFKCRNNFAYDCCKVHYTVSVVIGLCPVKTNNTGLDWTRLDIVQ